MVLKTLSALFIFLAPYFLMMICNIDNVPLLFLLWVIMGFGKAFVGMAVMHDSLHGSYSHRRWINQLIGMCTWLVGVDATNWKIQHNVLHHTYTNIDHIDEDIEPRMIFRFSPNQPRLAIQRFQHLYAFLFYGLSTLLWVTIKDFIKAHKYNSENLIPSNRPLALHIAQIIAQKIFYFSVFIVLPVICLPCPFWQVLLMFTAMHFTSSLILIFIFQCAHVLESSVFQDGHETPEHPEHRLVHQLKTTSNFGMNSRLLFWFSGGLNHQIEHHLFPNICHVHYRKISSIVRQTALEYNLPYNTRSSLMSAIFYHLKMLKALGAGMTS